MNYKEALETGKVVLRRCWKNERSTNDQITAQFAQKIDKPTDGTSNKLIAIAQGMEGMNSNVITALWSFNRKHAKKQLGLVPGDYFKDEDEDAIFAKDIFGEKVSIQVVENTTKNPLAPQQKPKMNPTTGEYLTFDGKPIYRHTTLVEGTKPRIELLQHNGTCTVDEYEEMEVGVVEEFQD